MRVLYLGTLSSHWEISPLIWATTVRPNGAMLLDFCVNHSFAITNTMFKHKGVQKYSWHQDTIGHRSMINFVIVSSGLRPYILDPWVKSGAELC